MRTLKKGMSGDEVKLLQRALGVTADEAFGKITEGLEVIDKIASVETGTLNAMFADVPMEAQVIKTIRIDEKE